MLRNVDYGRSKTDLKEIKTLKIIIVGQYYWPENFLVNDIAEDLVERGHTVEVLTGLPDYTTNLIPEEYRCGKNRNEVHNGVLIHRVSVIARRHGLLFRVLFWLTSTIYAKKHNDKAASN